MSGKAASVAASCTTLSFSRAVSPSNSAIFVEVEPGLTAKTRKSRFPAAGWFGMVCGISLLLSFPRGVRGGARFVWRSVRSVK